MPVAWHNKTCALAIMENTEKSLECLRKALQLDAMLKEAAKTDIDFTTFWENPDFQKLVE